MPDVYKPIGAIVNIRNLHIAKVTADTSAAFTAETPRQLAPMSEVTVDTPVKAEPEYYDGVAMWIDTSEGASVITAKISNLSTKDRALLEGKFYDATKGMMVDTGDRNNQDYFAISFEADTSSGEIMYMQYLKTMASIGQTKGQTTTDTKTPNTTDVVFSAVNTIHKFDVDGAAKPVKRVMGDTSDAAFTLGDTWYNQVNKPAEVTP